MRLAERVSGSHLQRHGMGLVVGVTGPRVNALHGIGGGFGWRTVAGLPE